GIIQADVSGGAIFVYGTDSQNSGSLKALNGGILALVGTLTNTATVSVDATSVLSLGGTLTGGTIATEAGARLPGRTLDGVTIDGDCTVSGHNVLEIQDNLTLNGTLTLGDSLTYGLLDFVDSGQTLGGSGTVVFSGGSPFNALGLTSGTVTIGPEITVRGQSGYLGYSPTLGGSPRTIAVVNQGTIQWANGGNIQSPGTLTNSGTITIDGASTMAPGGTIVGGTVIGQTGAGLGSGTLDGVTIDGEVQVVGNNGVTVQDG